MLLLAQVASFRLPFYIYGTSDSAGEKDEAIFLYGTERHVPLENSTTTVAQTLWNGALNLDHILAYKTIFPALNNPGPHPIGGGTADECLG
jgi:hypothetical protein